MSDLAELERNIPSLRRYAFTLVRNASDADDLVQDCLVRALDKLDTRAGGDMRPWLFTIMHNLSVSTWRRWRLRATVPLEDSGADVAVPAPQQGSAEFQDAMRGLDQLPAEQRQVLLLVAVEGFDYAQVADILKIPIGTVMSRLSRARDKLRDFMDGRERPMLRRVK